MKKVYMVILDASENLYSNECARTFLEGIEAQFFNIDILSSLIHDNGFKNPGIYPISDFTTMFNDDHIISQDDQWISYVFIED